MIVVAGAVKITGMYTPVSRRMMFPMWKARGTPIMMPKSVFRSTGM